MLQFALSLGSHVARGGSYIHSFNPPIIHRDMKSSNILLNEQRVAKISDFGLSRTKAKDATMTRCGSPLWCAPEILKGVHFDEKCDVYGYGIIMWEALAWKEPWLGVKMMQVINNVTNGKRPTIPAFVPAPIVELIKQCWAQEPKDRPSFKEVVAYLEEHEDLLEFDGDDELSEAVLTNMGMHPAVKDVQGSIKADGSMQAGLTSMHQASFSAATTPMPASGGLLQPPQNTNSSVEAMVSRYESGWACGRASNEKKNRLLLGRARGAGHGEVPLLLCSLDSPPLEPDMKILEGAELGDGTSHGAGDIEAGARVAGPKGQALASAAMYQQTLRAQSANLRQSFSQQPGVGTGQVPARQDSFYSRSLVKDTISGNETIHVGGAVQSTVSGMLTAVLSPSVSSRSQGKGAKWGGSARVAAADQIGPAVTVAAKAADVATTEASTEAQQDKSPKIEAAPGQAAEV